MARLVTGLLIAVALAAIPLDAARAASISVASARANQNGQSATVRGYVVGQPTSSTTVVTSDFPNDYALALADSPGVTDTGQMIYVQITGSFRSAWGLKSNPSLMGDQIEVTGTLTAYFARPGVKSPSAFAAVSGDPDPDPDPDPEDPAGGTDEYDGTYWASAMGLSGYALEAELHDIISSGVTKLSYSQVWNALKETDEDPNNPSNVIELYTGWSVPKSNHGGGVDQWNREHVWAKSHGGFGTSTGPGTDIHHLRPTDVTVNSDRGNLDFDDGGTENDEAPGNYADQNSWEPRDAVKGDVARMIFYMSVRYDGGDGWPDLEVNNQVSNGSSPYHGKLSTLLDWNAQDPPSAFEMNRNDVIFEDYQHNRNPFIDHPEWAEEIWG